MSSRCAVRKSWQPSNHSPNPMADIRIYNVEALGKPLGQYSHMARVKAGEFLFIAGMLAPGDDFDTQCAGVLAQIEKPLKSAGAGWGNVVQFTTYLVHSQDIVKFMQIGRASCRERV